MSAEFLDTNVFIYAYDGGAGSKQRAALALIERLFDEGTGAISIQVLTEFYSAATRKLGMRPEEVEEIILDLQGWMLHQPSLLHLVSASRLHRRHKLAWWDALILNSAIELGCEVLWSEDFVHHQKYGTLIVRNPFAVDPAPPR
jgi:predicted nucleic acid-binding protein